MVNLRARVPSRLLRRVFGLSFALSLAACVTGGLTGPDDVAGGGGGPALAGASSAGNTAFAAGSPGSVAGAPPIGVGGGSPMSGGAPPVGSAGVGGAAPMEQCNYPAWVAMKPYVTGDKVNYSGKGYVATADNPGYDPTVSTFFWSLLPCTPVVASAGGGTGSGGSTSGTGGATNTTSCARLDRLLAMGETTFNAMFQPPWAGHVAKAL
ncbi:MAG TPA: hypothetical protein VGL19_16960, partial [Polyangiaceae bacterium]